jgi:multiple inositol-polyphosphate phosphatase/2,3-bisphosphoglycerate 3-phosphatase
MKIKAFISAIISNILQIEYFLLTIHNRPTTSQHDNKLNGTTLLPQQHNGNTAIVTMDWILDHMGSRGNYPNYKLNNNDSFFLSDNITAEYTVEQMQLIIRHGTRYPVLSGMEAINHAHSKLNASSNQNLIGWIKSYKNEYLYRRTGQLDYNGQNEVYLIGRRLAANYPELISSLIDKDIVTQEFQASTSWSSRTSQSAQAFCLGVFEGLGKLGPAKLMSVPIFSLAQNNDSLIAFHKACPKWQRDAKKATGVILKPVQDRLLKPIATRLSADLGIDVTPEDVEDIHEACTSEVAMHHTVETFCKLMTREDVIQLEYIDDLKHYHKYSYGLPHLNDDMACDLGKHIAENIELKLSQQQQEKSKLDIKFGHSETLLPLRTLWVCMKILLDCLPIQHKKKSKRENSNCQVLDTLLTISQFN